MNELLRDGLVVRIANLAHNRSKLVSLTPKGRRTIAAMLERENTLLRALDLEPKTPQLLSAAKVLEDLRTAFQDPKWRTKLTEA